MNKKEKQEEKMKRIIALTIALCMVFTLCACGGSDDNGGQAKDSVIYSVAADNSTFDPVASMSVGVMMNFQVFETLIREESDGTLAPGLAESYEMGGDNLSVTFKLREGVKFHNGDTMTAEDVAFSLNRAIANSGLDSALYMKEATVVDETHVKLTLNSVYSDILSALSVANMSIVSKRAVEEYGEEFGSHPVGTGAYTLESWTPGVSIVYKAFPDYWRGEASIKNVTLVIQPDASTAAIALENKEVDAVNALNPVDVEHVEAAEGISVYRVNSVSTFTLYLNTVSGVLADARVRQAIALCIDKNEICDGALNGSAPAATIISPSMSYYNENFKVSEPNVEKAKQLLAEAGYSDGLTIKFATVAEAPDLVKIGEILMGQLKQIGITVEIDTKEYSTWFNDVQFNHDFDITCAATTANASTTNSILSNILLEGGVNNLGPYSNSEVTALLKQAVESYDDAEKQEIYDRVCEITLEDCPVIALATTVTSLAANSDLQGVVCPPVGSMYFYDWSWA